jgi:WD40 repeat protein
MALPIIETPKYEVQIPSTGKVVSYRPYLVREEKILMVALESQDGKQALAAIKDVIKACTFEAIDPNKLTLFDLEYVFLKLRAKSVGETTDVRLRCEKCETYTDNTINLDQIELLWPNGKKEDKTVKLWDKNSGQLLNSLIGHEVKVFSVAFADNDVLASWSDDKTITLWDKNTVGLLRSLSGHGNRVWQVAFDSNSLLTSASREKAVNLWGN